MKYEIESGTLRRFTYGGDNRSQEDAMPDENCIDPDAPQTHVHEFEGSTKLAEFTEDVHNHRYAGVSGQQINVPGGHVHKIITRTDFFDHFHIVAVITGLQIPVGNGKHVHFATGLTTLVDGHMHEFQFATLIDAPLLPEPVEQD